MSHTPMKKSVFERIDRSGGTSMHSSGTATSNHKSTHGICTTFIKTGACPLGDSCKYIHVQPNIDKQQTSKDELRITKTISRIVDMSPTPIKSTITVSNDQRSVSSSTSSSRTVVEGVAAISNDQSDRRASNADPKHSGRRSSDSKRKSASSKEPSKEKVRSSSKTKRPMDSDSPISSTSDSERTHSSSKRKKKSDTNSTSSSKYRAHESISPNNDEDETLHDQLTRQSQLITKSPKRTIVITDRKKDENIKRTSKDAKSNPDIEFLGSKIASRDKKSAETIHQQAENNKKSTDIKRERKSPSKSTSSEQQKRQPTSTMTVVERNVQIKAEDTKQHSNRKLSTSEQSDKIQATPPVVQLSPTPPIIGTNEVSGKTVVSSVNESERIVTVQTPSPVCVILDDDSSPTPSGEKKTTIKRSATPSKRTNDTEKNTSRSSKRSRESDKSHAKEKRSENTDSKHKRSRDDSSRKTSSSRKDENSTRSRSNRSDSHRNANTLSREESSSRKHKEKSEPKAVKSNESKDRSEPESSSKSRTTTTTITTTATTTTSDRKDTTRSSSEKKRATHRKGKEKGLESITDSEDHRDESVLPKQNAIEAYLSMDWSLLSRDKRIPLNTQTTSRIARIDNNINSIGVSERLLTHEQKQQLNDVELQQLPLSYSMKQLQAKTSSQIINSCNRRFGSCAKDMIDMRHKWFLQSSEPVQQYEFINKEHYSAFQQAINTLLDRTSTDTPAVQIETTTADVLLS